MMITRAVVASLIVKYHILPSETDIESWENSGIDAFTMEFPELMLKFTKRQGHKMDRQE
jgi:hypothetical protein